MAVSNRSGTYLVIHMQGQERTDILAPEARYTIEFETRPTSLRIEAWPQYSLEPKWTIEHVPSAMSNNGSLTISLSRDYFVLRLHNRSLKAITRVTVNNRIVNRRLPPSDEAYDLGVYPLYAPVTIVVHSEGDSLARRYVNLQPSYDSEITGYYVDLDVR